MHFITALLLAPLALASPLLATRDNSTSSTQPWQITQLTTHSPSGRPGNDPHTTLNFTVQNPNTPASTATCSAQWIQSDGFPASSEFQCEADVEGSAWSFVLLDGATGSSASNFGLNVTLIEGAPQTVYTADKQFSVGDNLSGQCGGSGVCNWSLKSAPLDLPQIEHAKQMEQDH